MEARVRLFIDERWSESRVYVWCVAHRQVTALGTMKDM